jgi:hypothetical protein
MADWEGSAVRWNPWARLGVSLLVLVVVGVILAAGELTQPPASAQSDGVAAATVAADAGYDPGPADGILGPRTQAALRKYIAVPPPPVPTPADRVIAEFRSTFGPREALESP